jgi:hypothetical protein
MCTENAAARGYTTLRDVLAKQAFRDLMARDYRFSDREMASAWAGTAYDAYKRAAFEQADGFLDTAERWIRYTSDGKLSTARTLKLPAR